MPTHESVCSLDCPDACGVLVETDDAGAFVRLRGNPAHPWSRGSLCSKTSAYGDMLGSPDRILYPHLREGGALVRCSWDDAIARIVERVRPLPPERILALAYAGNMGQVARHYPGRVLHGLGATFADGGICDAAADAGYRRVLGDPVGPRPGALDEADAVVVWGCDPRRTMPHLFSRLKPLAEAGVPVWVIDVYRSDTIEAVERWGGRSLILRPGTDAALALSLCEMAFRGGDADLPGLARRAQGAPAFRAHVAREALDLPDLARETGLDPYDITAFARDVHGASRPFLKIGIGFARRRNGGMSMRAVCSWAAVLGHEDRVHFQTWAHFGLRGHLAGSAAARPADVPLRTIPHVALGRELERGGFGAAFVWGHNPAATVPDARRVRRELARDELFLVVHELMPTETVALADVVLPATALPEHTDVLTSYGHRVMQVTRRSVEPPGEARSNVDAFAAIGEALGLPATVWDVTEEGLVDEILEGSRGHVDEADLQAVRAGRMVVPAFREAGADGGPRRRIVLHEDTDEDPCATYVPDDGADGTGRYRLVPAPSVATHNSTYATTARHRRRAAGARVFVNPEDAAALGLEAGQPLRLSNEQGAVTLPAALDERMPPGLVRVDGFPLEDEVPEGVGINALVPGALADLANGNSLYSTRVDLEVVTSPS